MESPSPKQNAIFQAALDCAAQVGWDDFSLEGVSQKSGISLADVQTTFPSKEAFLEAFLDHIQQDVESTLYLQDLDTLKDKVMEVLLIRFEALSPYKFWCQGVYEASFWDPKLACLVSKKITPYLQFAVEHCMGETTLPCQKEAYVMALGALYVLAFKTWLQDTSTDHGTTLAFLDQTLTQILSFFQFFQKDFGK